MGRRTSISWCDHTFNPWQGCTKISAGCKHCYAERLSNRFRGPGLWGPSGIRIKTSDRYWRDPLAWARRAGAEGVRRRVFCASMADVFEDRDELVETRRDLWALIEATPELDWLILTKRPENIERLAPERPGYLRLPANVWMGVSVEDQERADERISVLLSIKAAVRFVSAEPLLGPVTIGLDGTVPRELGEGYVPVGQLINWVVVGGESGPECRPMHLAWARALRDECGDAGVAFFMKQLGGHPDKREEPSLWPQDLRIREFPVT